MSEYIKYYEVADKILSEVGLEGYEFVDCNKGVIHYGAKASVVIATFMTSLAAQRKAYAEAKVPFVQYDIIDRYLFVNTEDLDSDEVSMEAEYLDRVAEFYEEVTNNTFDYDRPTVSYDVLTHQGYIRHWIDDKGLSLYIPIDSDGNMYLDKDHIININTDNKSASNELKEFLSSYDYNENMPKDSSMGIGYTSYKVDRIMHKYGY